MIKRWPGIDPASLFSGILIDRRACIYGVCMAMMLSYMCLSKQKLAQVAEYQVVTSKH